MHGLHTLDRINREASEKAQDGEKVPYHPTIEEIDNWPPFPFPSLCNYDPPGWEEDVSTRWLCDSTGFDESGFSYTPDRIKEMIRKYMQIEPNAGFAIVNQGQFQVVVSAFNPVQ